MTKILTVNKAQKIVKQGEKYIEILPEISFELTKGTSLAITGCSGSGKSTLLQCIGLLSDLSSGTIIIDQQNIADLNAKKKTKLRKLKLGFVYQYHYLLPDFSAIENITMPLLINGMNYQQASSKARDMLHKLDLLHREHFMPYQLSGGEQQRVAIGRAIIHEPQIVLADEATGNLDPENSQRIYELLISLVQDKNLSLLFVTHNLSLAQNMDNIIRIS